MRSHVISKACYEGGCKSFCDQADGGTTSARDQMEAPSVVGAKQGWRAHRAKAERKPLSDQLKKVAR